MKRSYHTLTAQEQANASKLAEFFSRHGQGLLPMVDLIEQSRMAIDELIDVAGRATIEAVLQLSAEEVAGAAHPRAEAHGFVLAWPASRVGVFEGTQTGSDEAATAGEGEGRSGDSGVRGDAGERHE